MLANRWLERLAHDQIHLHAEHIREIILQCEECQQPWWLFEGHQDIEVTAGALGVTHIGAENS
jgi:hypothetical protein